MNCMITSCWSNIEHSNVGIYWKQNLCKLITFYQKLSSIIYLYFFPRLHSCRPWLNISSTHFCCLFRNLSTANQVLNIAINGWSPYVLTRKLFIFVATQCKIVFFQKKANLLKGSYLFSINSGRYWHLNWPVKKSRTKHVPLIQGLVLHGSGTAEV